MASNQIQRRSVTLSICQHHKPKNNCTPSSGTWHTCHSSYPISLTRRRHYATSRKNIDPGCGMSKSSTAFWVSAQSCLKYYDAKKTLSTGPGSCSSPRCWPSRICIESAHWEPVWLQQHWTWTIGGRAWCRTLPPLPVCATIHSHHRPQTFGDHMPQALPRLQRLMLRIQGYNYCIEYRPGRDMLLADTLSRMPNPENKEEIPLDLRVDHIDICLIKFASKKQQQLLEEMPATQFCRNWSRWFMPDGQQPSKNCRWTYCHTGHSAMSCAQNLVSSARDDKSSSRPVWRQTSCNSNTLATRGSAKPNAGHATLFTGLISTRRLNGCGSRVKCARNTRKSNARHLCSPIPHRLDRGNPYLQTFSQ